MGSDSVSGKLLGLVSPVAGAIVNTKADKKNANKLYNQQREIFSAEQGRISKQQSVLDRQLLQAREKTARGIARNNKRRSKPSLLSETITSTPTSPTLGG